MKITTAQLRQIIREEIGKATNEADTFNISVKKIQQLQAKLEKLQKKMNAAKGPIQKTDIQGEMKDVMQQLFDIRKDLGVR